MLNYVDSAHENDSRRAMNALVPALLVSLTLHAALGGLFFHTSQRMPVELPKPLKVTMVEVDRSRCGLRLWCPLHRHGGRLPSVTRRRQHPSYSLRLY